MLDFQDYVLLGDDLVIAHHGVSREYLALLKELDMPINLTKSFQSEGFYEFAKRLI
jgi:hypothetical protein